MTSVQVFLHNESGEYLTRVSDELPGGEWTRRPPDRIEPDTVAVMGSESDGFLTGTEGRVTYQIGSRPESTVYLHWDNPHSGSNSYHTHTDDRHYSCWRATSGSDVQADFLLREAGRVETDFLPSRDGFKFDNSWPNTPYSLPPLRGSLLDYKYGNAKNGLCGGMTYAAADYFELGWEIPQNATAPLGEQEVQFLYLVDRLFASFEFNTVTLLLALMNPAYPDSDENMLSALDLASGRAAVMAHEEWPLIMSDIDSGRPSTVTLVTVKSLNPGDLGECHQVLAYAYEVHGHSVRFWVYDPNQPLADEVWVSFSDGDVANRIIVEHNVFETKPVYCFVRTDRQPAQPPERTRDRVTRAVQRSRRVILREEQKAVASTVVEQGRRQFDIPPDCGVGEFPYTITREQVETTMTAGTPGYRSPRLSWTVNNVPVTPGFHQELRVSDADLFPSPSPGPVTIRTSTEGRHLVLLSDPDDGTYSVTVRAQCREDGESDESNPPKHGILGIEVLAVRETVDGLREATGACFGAMVRRFQEVPTVDGAALMDAIRAQLHRPPDPLWDPDPALIDIREQVVLESPLADAVRGWEQEAIDLGAQVAGTSVVIVNETGITGQLVGTDIDTSVIVETAPGVDRVVDLPGLDVRLDRPQF